MDKTKNIIVGVTTANKAKFKNFNWEVEYYWVGINVDSLEIPDYKLVHKSEVKGYRLVSAAPTQSLLRKWLRDVHNIDLWFGMANKPNVYHVEDIIKDNIRISGIDRGSKTFEEALELGLHKALHLIYKEEIIWTTMKQLRSK